MSDETAAEKVRKLLGYLSGVDDDFCTSVPAGTLRELLAERDALASELAQLRNGLPMRILRQAWHNGWLDHGKAMQQAQNDASMQRTSYEHAFARYMSEDPAEADKDPYRPLDGPDDPAAGDEPWAAPCDLTPAEGAAFDAAIAECRGDGSSRDQLERFLTDDGRRMVAEFMAEAASESDDFDIDEAIARNHADAMRDWFGEVPEGPEATGAT